MNDFAVTFTTSMRSRFWGGASRAVSRSIASVFFISALIFLATQCVFALQSLKALQNIEYLNQSVQAEINALQVDASPTKKPSSQPHLSPQENAQLYRVVNLLNLPWSAVFNELELDTPPEIALVSLEPGGKGSIKMQCESLHLDLLLTYASTLENSGPFGKLLYSHHETNEKDPNKPVRLSFELAQKVGGRP